MSLDSLSFTYTQSITFSAAKVANALEPLKRSGSFSKSVTLSKGTGAGNANDIYFANRSLVASGSEEIDLSTALTNIVGDETITIDRVKAVFIWLLGAADTVGVGAQSVTGNACSAIRVGNATTNSFQGPISAGATIDVFNGQIQILSRPDATGFATATADMLKVENQDAVNGAEYILGLVVVDDA